MNNYCYVKSQVRITRDFLFVDLRKETESTYFQIFTSKLSIYIKQNMMQLNRGLSV